MMRVEAEPKPRRRRNESLCGAPVARFAVWAGPQPCGGMHFSRPMGNHL